MNDILSPERIIDHLSAQPIFSDLDPVSLRVLALASEIVPLQPGERLFSQGDISDCAYFILKGYCRLDNFDGDARTAQAGDLLHPLALMAELARPMTAVAADRCEVLKIPRAVFIRILESAPVLAMRLRDKLTRDMMGRIRELQPVHGNLA